MIQWSRVRLRAGMATDNRPVRQESLSSQLKFEGPDDGALPPFRAHRKYGVAHGGTQRAGGHCEFDSW